jgi:coiled-coil domain-containing protein 55
MKLSFSLNKPIQSPAPIKRPSAFSLADDGDPEGSGLQEKSQGEAEPLAYNAHSSQVMRKRMEAEKRVDETVFEYDEVWDKMQEAKLRQQASKEADASFRKVASVQYIHPLNRLITLIAEVYT